MTTTSDIDGHIVTSLPEQRRVGDRTVTRHRGRCSCGRQSFMHYSTPEAARTALRRTHIVSLTLNEGSYA